MWLNGKSKIIQKCLQFFSKSPQIAPIWSILTQLDPNWPNLIQLYVQYYMLPKVLRKPLKMTNSCLSSSPDWSTLKILMRTYVFLFNFHSFLLFFQQLETSTWHWNLSKGQSLSFWSWRERKQNLLSEPLFVGQVVSGSQNLVLRCGAFSLLCFDEKWCKR